MTQATSLSRDPNALIGVGLPDPIRGYADDPNLAAWAELAPRGRPVTIAQHNTFVASLAWCQAMLAAPIGAAPQRDLRSLLLGRMQDDGDATLYLGASGYTSGDIALPAAQSAGAAAILPSPPVPPSPPAWSGVITIPDATRRRRFDAATRNLENLRLYPQNLVLVRETEPAGNPYLVGAAIVSLVGAGIYAGYRAYVDARVGVALAQANAQTEQVRIQQQAWLAAQANEQHARLQAYAMQLAYAQKMRSIPPLPAWADREPITIPQPALPPPGGDPSSSGWSTLEIVGATLGGLAAVGGGVWASTKTTKDGKPW
jgi:hypothetical protein